MKLGELIRKQFAKAGIDLTAAELKDILAIDTDVPDEIANKVDGALLTVEAAKSNSEVNKFLRKKHLDAADKKIAALIAELELEPGEDFTGEESTYEKIGLLTKMANAAGKKAAAPGATGKEAQEWAKKEADYNKAILDLKKAVADAGTNFTAKENQLLTDFEFQKILLGKTNELDLPKDLDADLKLTTVKGAIEKDLNKNGFKLIRNEANQLQIVDKDGNPAYDKSNAAIEPNAYFTGVLTQSKLLKVNKDDNGGGKSDGDDTIDHGKGKNPANTTFVSEIDAQLNSPEFN